MNSALHIVVMLGGPSAEREVSLRTGHAVANALKASGHSVTEIDPSPGNWNLPPNTDVVFLALHGFYGEDGSIQKELERIGVPYTGCDPEASRSAFDKILAKERFLKAGVRTPKYIVVTSPIADFPKNVSPPLVVKPVCQGSSVGLAFVDSEMDWTRGLQEALAHDQKVIVEQRIIGRETTVGILGGEVLPIVEVRPKKGGYDYSNKYTSGATDYFCPAEFPRAIYSEIQTEALAAFHSLGCRDYGRVDVMVDAEGKPWVLEVNTLPGMTETSLFPKAAAALGISYNQLCEQMVQLALRRKVSYVV